MRAGMPGPPGQSRSIWLKIKGYCAPISAIRYPIPGSVMMMRGSPGSRSIFCRSWPI